MNFLSFSAAFACAVVAAVVVILSSNFLVVT
jgi:hypothetical protein